MNKFKVGDRVAFYNAHRWPGIVIGVKDYDILEIKLDHHPTAEVLANIKQCRKLVKKKKPEIEEKTETSRISQNALLSAVNAIGSQFNKLSERVAKLESQLQYIMNYIDLALIGLKEIKND